MDDQDRGELVTTLYDVLWATSFYNTTAVRTSNPEVWQICTDYRYPAEGYTVEHHWCYFSDDPQSPPPPDAPPGWLERFTKTPIIHYENHEGETCDCLFSSGHAEWVGEMGPWGGWTFTWDEGGGCRTIKVEIYPVAWDGADITWQWKWYQDGSLDLEETITQDKDQPPYAGMTLGDMPWCPLSAGVVTTSPDDT